MKFKNKILGFRDWPDDWDGMGSAKVTEEAIQKALYLLEFGEPEDATPTGMGGILIIWTHEPYSETEVFSDGEAEYMETAN